MDRLGHATCALVALVALVVVPPHIDVCALPSSCTAATAGQASTVVTLIDDQFVKARPGPQTASAVRR